MSGGRRPFNMKFDLKHHETHVAIAASGPWELMDVFGAFELLHRECRERKCSKGLLDLREVTGQPAQMDWFYLGERVASMPDPKPKIAVVHPAEFEARFAETTAANRGAVMHVFSDPGEALRWLLEGLAP